MNDSSEFGMCLEFSRSTSSLCVNDSLGRHFIKFVSVKEIIIICHHIMNLGSVQQQYSLSHSISVDKASCEYTGVIKFNAPNANLPFPDAAQCALGPPPPDTKAPPSYKFSKDFYKATGFDHLGLDWQPCGHPDPNKFGKPHFDFHLYRITSTQRDLMSCDILQGAPICDFLGAPLPGGQTQTTYAGKKFFAVGKVTAGSDANKIANMPELFTVDLGSAVPHSGIHVYDINGAVDVVDWTDPVLIIGSYDSQVVNWEPMFPYSFVSGYTR